MNTCDAQEPNKNHERWQERDAERKKRRAERLAERKRRREERRPATPGTGAVRRLYPFLCLLSLLGVAACLCVGARRLRGRATAARSHGRLPATQSQGAATTKRASAESKRAHLPRRPRDDLEHQLPAVLGAVRRSAYPAGYISGIDRWFADLAHDSGGLLNTDSVLTQYGDSEGGFANYNSHFGGPLIDTDPYPTNGCKAAAVCLTDEQLRIELQSYAEGHVAAGRPAARVLRAPATGRVDLLRSVRPQCSEGTAHFKYCSYHSFFKAGVRDLHLHGQPIRRNARMRGRKPQRKPLRRRHLRRPRARAQRVGDRPGINRLVQRKARRGRRQMPLLEPVEGIRDAAGDRTGWRPVQPADRRRRVPLPADVEQRTCRLRAARGAAPGGHQAVPQERSRGRGDEGHGHRLGLPRAASRWTSAAHRERTSKCSAVRTLTVVAPEGTGEVDVVVHTEAGTSVAGKKTVYKYKPAKKPNK